MNDLSVFDPFLRIFTRWYLKKCSKCDKVLIESILQNYQNKNFCSKCKKKVFFGKIPLKTIMFFMGMNNYDLKELSNDKEVISSVNALFRGMQKYGLKSIKNGIPIYAVFDITNKCNLRCIHCYSSEQYEDLTTEEVYHVLDMLFNAGIGMIDFGGGEPLLREDIFDIIKYSKKLGFYTSISTNGILLNYDYVKHLKKLDIDHVCISLDGVNPRTHDFIRNKKGSYEKTLNGIKNCVNAGINTQVSTVFMKSNINELSDLYDLLQSLKVDGWYVYDFVPAGRGKEIQKEVLDPKQREKLYIELQQLAVTSKISLKPYPYLVTINSTYDKKSFFYRAYGQLSEIIQGCPTARWTCHISNNGDMHPCHLLPFKLGNLKQENFADIWFSKNNKVLNDLRDRTLLKGNCKTCKYRDVCGGCRAQAYWRTGDYLEGDNCWVKT